MVTREQILQNRRERYSKGANFIGLIKVENNFLWTEECIKKEARHLRIIFDHTLCPIMGEITGLDTEQDTYGIIGGTWCVKSFSEIPECRLNDPYNLIFFDTSLYIGEITLLETT